MDGMLASLPAGLSPDTLLPLLARFLGVTAGCILFLLLAALIGCLILCRRPK